MQIYLVPRHSELRFVRSLGRHTSYHKVPLCAAEQLSVDQPFDLGLREGRLEIRMEAILDEFFR